VRTEEMVNYFAYDYPQPQGDVPFAIHTEVGECPWNRSRLLLLIGLQGQNLNLQEAPANNLVFLIDVSGSMSSEDRLPLVKKALRHLVEQLRAQDRVAIVVYAGAAGLALPSTPGSDMQAIVQALDALQSGGSTAGGAGIQLAYQVALENFIAGGNNRVILATDGDFNVGTKSLNELERLIEHKRKDGVYLTCLGFGMGNYKDNRLELLADKGNGNYAYIDNLMEARKVFGTELTGTLYTIAKDVKIQIEFNPLTVDSFRLIGYENRLLAKEDFDDDAKDAGELGAGHSVTALYEIIPRQSDAAQLAKIQLRYKLPDKKQSRLIEAAPLAETVNLEATSDNFRFAAAVAAFSLILRKSKYAADMNFEQVVALAESALGADSYAYRREFVELVKLAQDISEENEQ
jgi:Ca-activated chloride channel homolog